MATLTVALVVSVPVWLVLSIRSYVGWKIDRTLRLVGGVLLMGVASVAGILLARSAWRRTARPAVAVMGTLLALLVALLGAFLLVSSVAVFPGPLKAVIS